MSLRFFHFAFILAAMSLAAACGVIGLSNYRQFGQTLDVVVGVVAIILAFAFLVYGIWFLKKTRHLNP